MKNTVIIILILLLKCATISTAQKQKRKSAKPHPAGLTWQQFDSLGHDAIFHGDTSSAISYLECAAALNNKMKPALDRLKKKYAQNGSSFYLKEY